MKKYIIPIFLAVLCVCLPLTSCKTVHFNEADFVLKEGENHKKYRGLYYKYFTDADYGNIAAADNGQYDIYFLVEGGAQTENVKRFIELANAELEKHQFSPIRTRTVKYSYQELLDASNRMGAAADRGEFGAWGFGINVPDNCIEVVHRNISESDRQKVLKYAPEDMVVFVDADGVFIPQ